MTDFERDRLFRECDHREAQARTDYAKWEAQLYAKYGITTDHIAYAGFGMAKMLAVFAAAFIAVGGFASWALG